MASKDKLMHPKAGLAAALLSGIVMFSAYSWAADPVLATQPLGATSNLVKPNLMFVFDTSTSMGNILTNDALKRTGQCKAVNGSAGVAVTKLKRTGTNLEITAVGLNPIINQHIYLTVPKNPMFSGKYKVTDNLVNCIQKNTTVIVGPVAKFNERPYVAGGNDVGTQTGCVITSLPPPIESGSSSQISYNNGASSGGQTYTGGFTRNPDGTATTTVDKSCYWVDYSNSPPGTVCQDTGLLGKSIITVTVADDGQSGVFDSEYLEGAAVTLSGDDSTCYEYEPPRAAAKIQSLFYDPSVEYMPPPDPVKVGLGTLSPANRLPSMTSANTSAWSLVRDDGTSLTNNVKADRSYMKDRVFCDTPIRPAGYGTDKAWFESSRCKRNTEDVNKASDTRESIAAANKSRYPYQYPATTSGRSRTHSSAVFYSGNELHQHGLAKPNNENPVADDYVFAMTNKPAPFYYNVRAIEYCKSDKLNDCIFATAETGAYTFPAYVRYCKDYPSATDLFTSPPAAGKCQGLYTGDAQSGDPTSGFFFARYGMFDRTDVTKKDKDNNDKTFVKAAARTDCTTAADHCTYEEEMTNMANWYAYYRTRLLMMKSVAGRAFDQLDDKIRVGMITIDGYNTNATNYLAIKDFDNAQKQLWLQRVYSRTALGDTPLRQVLSKVGQIYAGKKPITGFTAAVDDPVQFSCQKNFTLLTTDGYWNQAAGTKIDGAAAIGDQDGGATPRPRSQGNTASDTLADVAEYYYDTDLRTSALGNCSPGGVNDVCANDVPAGKGDDVSAKQHMTTLTLGLGVNGNLNYTTNYNDPNNPDTTSDYAKLEEGTLNWPVPATNGDDGTLPLTISERATVDDLWHAAVNGRGTYYSVKNTQDLIDGLSGAILDLGDGKGTGSTTALSNIKPVAGDNYAYSARYFTGTWSGNLFKRTIDGEGTISAKALNCVEDDASVSCVQDSGTGLGARVHPTTDDRTIYANVSGTLKSFEYGELTGTQKEYFEKSYFDGTTAGQKLSQWDALSSDQKTWAVEANLVNYLRGQTAYDGGATDINQRLFRQRSAVLGDVIDSDPVFVGKSQYHYSDAGYLGYVDTAASNTSKTVYIGANDGMLHAFDWESLKERWAYVPTMVMPNMWKLADKDYRHLHTNFVNGKMTVSDIKTEDGWKTILVGGLGQGGRGFFALDITNPASPKMLWEKSVSDSDYHDLGYSYGKPVITKKADGTADGTWVVLITSGYNNTSPGDGKDHLYVLDAYTGDLIKDIAPAEGSGLAQISGYASDATRNNTAQYVYGGDLLGNVWRFDIDANTAFKLTTLVSASNEVQPITVAPTLGAISNKRILFIGTGKYIEVDDTDAAHYKTQSIYAIKDDNEKETITGLRGQMVEQTLTTTAIPATANTPAGSTRTVSDENPVDWTKKLGWYVDLGDGERQNIKAYLISGVLIVPTNIPAVGSCSVGSGWVNVFNYKTGGAVGVSHVVSTSTSTMLTGLYFTFSDAKPDVAFFNTDTSGGSTINDNKAATNPPCKEDPSCEKNNGSIPLPAAFSGGRATWRELIPAE